MRDHCDMAIVGAGAAGLMAAIWAARTSIAEGHPLKIVVLDGARHIGAKILVSGGGRCNVTHDVVDERSFSGSSRNAIKKVLLSFGVQRTASFFGELDVELKREDTGKLFPVTDSARTVLGALLAEVDRRGVELCFPFRVQSIEHQKDFFALAYSTPTSSTSAILKAKQVVLATGGMSLPKTGSDGSGYALARAFGHSVTPHIFPALVPLLLPKGHPLCGLSGISTDATLEVCAASGRRIVSFTDATLCTHFGLSGPGPLDVSRHLTSARHDDPEAFLRINWLPRHSEQTLDQLLLTEARAKHAVSSKRLLTESGLPLRLAETLCGLAQVEASESVTTLTRQQRKSLVREVTAMQPPIIGDRGFGYAEVTAGGVPLSELQLHSMESKKTPGLYIIGELCDVDGRIGGYNFQWAWSSGYLAGRAAARAALSGPIDPMADSG